MTNPESSEATAETVEFPTARRCPFGSPDRYDELRATEPVKKVTLSVNGRQAWLLTRYADIRYVLGKCKTSANMKLPGYPVPVNIPEEAIQMSRRILFNLDAPEHTVQRRLLGSEFTVKRVEILRPRVKEILNEFIDRILLKGSGPGPIDLMAELAYPFPSQVISELLGIPKEDHATFQRWAADLMNSETTPEQHQRADVEMYTYLHNAVVEKESDPVDDLPSRLIAKNREEDRVSRDDIVWLTNILNGAAHETTANNIGLGVLALLQNPEQLAELKADPTIVGKLVEEVLRYSSTNDWGTSRVALEDIEVGGVTIKAGDGIITARSAGNYDPEVFTDPQRFDIHRKAVNHLAFGYGAHQCVAANLARMELGLVFTTLFERIPDLRLAVPFDEVPARGEQALIHGLAKLPVTW